MKKFYLMFFLALIPSLSFSQGIENKKPGIGKACTNCFPPDVPGGLGHPDYPRAIPIIIENPDHKTVTLQTSAIFELEKRVNDLEKRVSNLEGKNGK